MTIETATVILASLMWVVTILVLPVWLSAPSHQPPQPAAPMTTRDWVELLLQQQPAPPSPLPQPTVPGIRDRIRLVSAELADTKVYLEDTTEIDLWEEDTIPEVFYPSSTRVGH